MRGAVAPRVRRPAARHGRGRRRPLRERRLLRTTRYGVQELLLLRDGREDVPNVPGRPSVQRASVRADGPILVPGVTPPQRTEARRVAREGKST